MFNIQQLDETVVLWIIDHLRCPFLDQSMTFISWLGNHGTIWILMAAFLIIIGGRYRKIGLLILLSLGVEAILANIILKPMVQRMRPYDILGYQIIIEHPKDFSFPSGHTAAAFAAAMAIFLEHKLFGIGMFIFAVLMAFSRLYLGVHFPTDILAGAVIGMSASIGVSILMKKWVLKGFC